MSLLTGGFAALLSMIISIARFEIIDALAFFLLLIAAWVPYFLLKDLE